MQDIEKWSKAKIALGKTKENIGDVYLVSEETPNEVLEMEPVLRDGLCYLVTTEKILRDVQYEILDTPDDLYVRTGPMEFVPQSSFHKTFENPEKEVEKQKRHKKNKHKREVSEDMTASEVKRPKLVVEDEEEVEFVGEISIPPPVVPIVQPMMEETDPDIVAYPLGPIVPMGEVHPLSLEVDVD